MDSAHEKAAVTDVDPNREAELAHELEELKVQVDTQVKALHVLHSRMAVIMLRLSAIRTSGSEEHNATTETQHKIAALEVEIATQWLILDSTPVSDRAEHHRIRNAIQGLVAREHFIKRGLGDPNDRKS